MAVRTTAKAVVLTTTKTALICSGIAGGMIFLSGPGIWVYQIFHWLRYGNWYAIPATTVIPIDRFAHLFYWVGIQKIILWFSDLPLAIYCIVFGIWIGGAGLLTYEKHFESKG